MINIIHENEMYNIQHNHHFENDLIKYAQRQGYEIKEHYRQLNPYGKIYEIQDTTIIKKIEEWNNYTKPLKYYNKYLMIENDTALKTIKINPHYYRYLGEEIKELKTKIITTRYFIGTKKVQQFDNDGYRAGIKEIYQLIKIELHDEQDLECEFNKVKISKTTMNNKFMKEHKKEINEYKKTHKN